MSGEGRHGVGVTGEGGQALGVTREGGRKPLLFIESNTTGTGRLFVRAAREIGCHPVLVTARPQKYAYLSEEAAPQTIVVPRIDVEAIATLIRGRFRDGADVAGITSSSEYFVATAAALAARFGLPGPDARCVEAARDKGHQRRVLADAGLAVPRFRVVRSAAEAEAAAREIGLPVIVKPTHGSGSVGVRAAASAREAGRQVQAVLSQAVPSPALPSQETAHAVGDSRAIVESMVFGPEFSVEVFSGRVIGITRKHLGAPPCFVEVGHDYPVVPAEAARIRGVVGHATRLLGLMWGPLHWELRISDGVVYPIEVNPRLAGGFIPELVREAEGIDLIRETLRLVVGERTALEPLRHRHASIRFLVSSRAGRLAAVDGLDQARAMRGAVDVALYRAIGDALTIEGDFRDRLGHVICAADRAEDAAAWAERARDAVRVRVGEPGAGVVGASVEDTGRIREALDWRARRILFDRADDRGFDEECRLSVQIDRAHLVMLVERAILSPAYGRLLLAALDSLEAQGFAPLRGRAAPRGFYLAYEQWLRETLGESVGGALHVGRSRNDINATVVLLRLRPVYRHLLRELLRLLAVLVRRAERYATVAMPVYTHYQAALPITYGHYLAGVGVALLRDVQGIEASVGALDGCPLGAGAGGGTTVPIDTERTAELLGFACGPLHSVQAVASRDLVLRLLAAVAVLGVTLSRLATDLQLWSTSEFDLIRFPDRLVGSSSMLPQKRNAFLLEHVQGRAGAPLGAFTAAATAMHATPFTNSIAVGTEGVKPLWHALAEMTDTVVLVRLAVAGAQPRAERMRARAIEGFTAATELANRLVREAGLSFRQAHRAVGELVTASLLRHEPLEIAAEPFLRGYGLSTTERGWLDPAVIAAQTTQGGGPAPASLRRVLAEVRGGWTEAARRLANRSQRWQDGARALALATSRVLAEHDARGAMPSPSLVAGAPTSPLVANAPTSPLVAGAPASTGL